VSSDSYFGDPSNGRNEVDSELRLRWLDRLEAIQRGIQNFFEEFTEAVKDPKERKRYYTKNNHIA